MLPTATLPGAKTPTTAVGFGCNNLLGPRSRREGLALLGAAYDAGIRHFDVARAYSSGDAEGVVGEFLAGGNRRESCTITTKFGLQPPSGGVARLKWLKALARRLMRLSPALRRRIGRLSGSIVQQGAFAPDQAGASLETSLRELKVDRIDCYLLHEASLADCTPELATFLDSAEAEGRIGVYGTGSKFMNTREIARERPAFCRVLQFDSSAVHRHREQIPDPDGRFLITHGAISGSFTHLRGWLSERPEIAGQWSSALGVDVSDAKTLAPLMLTFAIRDNPGGIVLFSSTRAESIRENVRAIAEGRFPDDQVDRFGELVRALSEGSGRSPSPLG